MPTEFGLWALGFSAVLASFGCSAGSGAGSQATHDPGSGSGAVTGAGGAGSVVSGGDSTSINTSSGDMSDAGADCGKTLDVTYRDFSEAHPDFEMPFSGDVVRRGLLQATLGPDQKPVFLESIGHPPLAGSPTEINKDWTPTQPVIQSAATFAQWYNTTAGVNIELAKTMKLEETTPGSGLWGYDSSAFFPLAPSEGFGITPKGNDLGMNFLFTTEIHVLFMYTAAQQFTFRGDDDMWIFVNGKLALDLGSMHGPEEGTIDFDAQAASLGISVGASYAMDIFHAERHMRGSNFKITTNIACFVPGVVK